jgi:glyoxylase-like metal-dependent hydrolase (beta-lactamase superfamily II)
VKVSDHVWVIPDGNVGAVPNVGIVAGNRATLVIDTGLGPRNGQTVLREVGKVSQNKELYVVSTHFHPEHALGEAAFSSARLLRAQSQQKDIDEFGLSVARNFAGRSAMMAELLKDVEFRRADELFEGEKVLDLGGVRVRLLSLGPTHTRGDTMAFVEGDAVLFSGDVVMNHRFVSFASPYSSVRAWLSILDRLEPMRPVRIVPSHGNMGDAALIANNRNYLRALQARVTELKSQGKTSDEVSQLVTSEFQSKYPDWTGINAVQAAARSVYSEAQ